MVSSGARQIFPFLPSPLRNESSRVRRGAGVCPTAPQASPAPASPFDPLTPSVVVVLPSLLEGNFLKVASVSLKKCGHGGRYQETRIPSKHHHYLLWRGSFKLYQRQAAAAGRLSLVQYIYPDVRSIGHLSDWPTKYQAFENKSSLMTWFVNFGYLSYRNNKVP